MFITKYFQKREHFGNFQLFFKSRKKHFVRIKFHEIKGKTSKLKEKTQHSIKQALGGLILALAPNWC